MTSYSFNLHAKLHCFTDGSGLAIYNKHAGDTLFLRSEGRDASAVAGFISLLQFNQRDLASALGICANQAQRVLEYLLDHQLIDNLSGS